MEAFDQKTLLYIVGAMSLLFAGIMWLFHKLAPSIKGPFYWSLAAFSTVIGSILNTLGSVLGDYISGTIGGTFIVLSGAFYLAGIQTYRDQKIDFKILYALIIAQLFFTNFFQFVLPLNYMRMISFSFFFMVASLLIIREFLKPAQKPYQIVYYMCAFVFGIMVMTSMFRIINIISNVLDRSNPVFSDTLFYFLANIAQTLLMFSLLLLITVKMADRLELKIKFQRKFFSIIAHDLNGPVGMMNVMLAMANKGNLIDSVEQHQMYAKVEQLSSSTYHLLNNLLHWSRNQMEDLHPFVRNFDLTKMIRKNINLMQQISESKTITIAFDELTETYCEADVQMTDTIIRNLISNAIKFSYSGGIIRISIENSGMFRVLRIADSGTGISDEVKKDLFKFMENSSVPGTSGEKGTGLGLVLCKEFVELNKGSILINSNLGEGTEVVVSLPAATGI